MTKSQIFAHIQTWAESTAEVAEQIFGILESSRLVWRDAGLPVRTVTFQPAAA